MIQKIQSDLKSVSEKSEEEIPSMAESFQDMLTSTVETIAPSVVSIIVKKDLIIYRSDPWGFFQQPAGTVTRQV